LLELLKKEVSLIVLGIDPGSITTGWALLEVIGNKTKYLDSGVLQFDKKQDFLARTSEIKKKFQQLVSKLDFDEVSLESLIFVKSPTSLIKLSQTRGIMLAILVDHFESKIFEYAPNLVKSSAVGYGHANKESIRKFLDMTLGKQNYKTHDESDACAIALCHIINRRNSKLQSTSKGSRSLKNALAHKIG
jgi:crossover junction endodeoxyribonuclease RuvC